MRDELPSWAPEAIDLDVPSVARVYDYVLGGGHNFESDRRFAERLANTYPVIPRSMRENRAFLRRAVTFLADQGIDQFLDVGSGIPSAGSVHEVLAAHGHADARVAYLDRDPLAVLHSRTILAGHRTSVAMYGDFTDVDGILGDPQVTELLDFDRPLGVLLVALLHAVGDADQPWKAVAHVRDRLAPGSYLVITHACDEGPTHLVKRSEALSRETSTPWTTRSMPQIAQFFDGFDLVDPGLVYLPLWRPDDPAEVPDNPDQTACYAGVARRP